MHVLAIRAGRMEPAVAKQLLELLLRNGADINATTESMPAPLFGFRDPGSAWLVAEFLAAGADPNASLHNTFFTPILFFSTLFEAGDILRALARAGADVNYRCGQIESTPLLMAAQSGRIENLIALSQLGANVLARDGVGWGVMHNLAQHGHVAAIRRIGEFGGVVDHPDDNGFTPLMLAATGGNVDSVIALLDVGADPGRVDNLGLSALDYTKIIADVSTRVTIQRLLEK